MAELEDLIKGSPHEEARAVEYEIKRSQCDFLFESNLDSEDSSYEEQPVDQDGFHDLSYKYTVDHSLCAGRELNDVRSQIGEEEMDIKLAYLTPDRCRFIRRKIMPNDSSDSVFWDLSVRPSNN